MRITSRILGTTPVHKCRQPLSIIRPYIKSRLCSRMVLGGPKRNRPILENPDGGVRGPSGKFDVLVIDPPWPMKRMVLKVHRSNEKPELDYKTMSLEEIGALNVIEKFAAENAHIFLWTTNRFLPSALEIFKKWGVKYSLVNVWHKNGGPQPLGLPQFNSELCLYGRVGKPKFSSRKKFATCFYAKRTGHSRKPEEFYETLRRVTKGQHRIDIFNRRLIEGFDGWGDQSPSAAAQTPDCNSVVKKRLTVVIAGGS